MKTEGCIKRHDSTEKGQILLRKTLIDPEESYQTGFEKERRIKSFIEKDEFCSKKSLKKRMGFVFPKKEEFNINRRSCIEGLSATSDFTSKQTRSTGYKSSEFTCVCSDFLYSVGSFVWKYFAPILDCGVYLYTVLCSIIHVNVNSQSTGHKPQKNVDFGRGEHNLYVYIKHIRKKINMR